MNKKRYAIVRVDERCPVEEEEDISLVDRIKMFPCFNDKRLSCKNCRYGDTKEQLIKKVAQVFFRRKLKVYKKVLGGEILSKKYLKRIYEKYLEVAKEIVEFLGVE